MARRIGFGDSDEDRMAPVRRRGEAPMEPATPSEAARRRDEREKTLAKSKARAPSAPKAGRRPWGQAAPRSAEPAAAEPRRRGFSIGKTIFLVFFWFVLVRWALASYGGVQGAVETLRAVANGWVDPIPALFPLIMPLAVGLFVTGLVTSRGKKG